MAIIINTGKSIRTFSVSLNPGAEGSQASSLLVLNPGINALDDRQAELWELLREGIEAVEAVEAKGDKTAIAAVRGRLPNKDLEAYLEAGVLVVGVGKNDKELKALPEALLELDDKMALTLVKACVSSNQLATWLTREKRPKLRQAVEEQLAWAKDFDRKLEEARV